MGPHPAVAEVRRAVRTSLADLPPGALVLVACSGGPDSLALAAALGFVAPRAGLRAGLVTVDHGLQEGSAERAEQIATLAPDLGLSPARVLRVNVGSEGGPEAAARRARYAALDRAAAEEDAAAVLLGHTRDDQAETVLLRLARGSGTRSLSAMAEVSGVYRRPLLAIPRRITETACAALGLTPWDDPHNHDVRFTRVRVRRRLLPLLERELGPGIAEALARTARQCREDADALDEWAERAYLAALSPVPKRVEAEVGEPVAGRAHAVPGAEGARPAEPAGDGAIGFADGETASAPGPVGLAVPRLEELPAAVRRRVLRRAAVTAGSPAGALSAKHLTEAERLITEWHGQRRVDLPGGVTVERRYGTLIVARAHP